MNKFIDLSVAIESGLPSDPPIMIPKITYVDHALGAESMKTFFPGLTAGDLPGGLGWAVEILEVSTHAGTHMDAPWHFHPTQDQGKLALTIDQFPLEWGVGSGVKLDFSDFSDGYNITVEDIKAKLDKIGHTLSPGDVFLAQSGAALKELAADTLISAPVDEKQDRVTELFDKYNLLTLPVVDEEGRLAGVITADDIISVLRNK